MNEPGLCNVSSTFLPFLENADQQERIALIRELAILIHVGRHPNIVSLVGACTFEGNESLSVVESP